MFGSCVFDLLAILGVVCVRLPADYDSRPSQHLAPPLMLYFLAWTAVATATDMSLFYADVETTWPASMTMVALYVAFVVGTFVCHRIFPGFVGEESASATLPTHALPPTPTAIVASQSRAVGGYQGGGAVGGYQGGGAVGGYQGGGGCEREGGSGAQQAPSAANAAALSAELAALKATGALSQDDVLDANRALATLLAHGGSSSALPPRRKATSLSPPPSPPSLPPPSTPGGSSSPPQPQQQPYLRPHESTPLLLSPAPPLSVPGDLRSPNPSPPGTDGALPGKGHGEGLGVGDTPLVSDRLSRRMEALFELLAAPPRSLFRLTVPDPNIALAALGGGRPWVLTLAICIVYTLFLSYSMVAVASRAICLLGVRKNSLGATVLCLAAGFPDLLTAMILVKRPGMLGMAASNPFGAFLFNALIALGLPWLILGSRADVFARALFPHSSASSPSSRSSHPTAAAEVEQGLGYALLGLCLAYLYAIIYDGTTPGEAARISRATEVEMHALVRQAKRPCS